LRVFKIAAKVPPVHHFKTLALPGEAGKLAATGCYSQCNAQFKNR